MIYYAQLPTGDIKIGCSADVETRLDQLEGHYGAELALLATMEGDRSTEAEIHARFAHLRLGRTEQFRPGADLMEFIGKPLLVGANPDAVEAISSAAAELKLTAVKAERDIVTKAKMIAADGGIPLAGCLSDGLRGLVERDWLKMVKRADQGGVS
jgi:hypothetical protein